MHNLSTTQRLGKIINSFAKKFSSHIVTLEGNLGSGKTTLCKSIISNYLDQEVVVTSPTFTLLNIYENKSKQVYHYDLYRLRHENELLELGIEEAISTKALILFEWPKFAQNYLKRSSKVEVQLFCDKEQDRTATIKLLH